MKSCSHSFLFIFYITTFMVWYLYCICFYLLWFIFSLWHYYKWRIRPPLLVLRSCPLLLYNVLWLDGRWMITWLECNAQIPSFPFECTAVASPYKSTVAESGTKIPSLELSLNTQFLNVADDLPSTTAPTLKCTFYVMKCDRRRYTGW